MNLLYANLVPDFTLRLILRGFIWRNIRDLENVAFQESERQRRKLLDKFERSPIAIHTQLPNAQHYEVPPAFFKLVLGRRLKYSCCYWSSDTNTLDEAEEKMLDMTCQRARLKNGMTVLDLGCGWGSLTLWIAEHYPNCKILAVSKSRDQIEHIQSRVREMEYRNVEARVLNMNDLEGLNLQFDRVFSVEMFEHMKNYRRLMAIISEILNPGGRLFVHIFSHRLFAYEFNLEDTNNWMAQTFFTGGTMPSDDLLLHYQDTLRLVEHWRISGQHYAKTLRAWLEKMDRHKTRVQDVLAEVYGVNQMQRWWINWRLFFLACEATWAYRCGREYIVSNYLFEKR